MAAVFDRDRFEQLPIIGILRGVRPDQLMPLVAAARKGGLLNLEITMNTSGAAAMIRDLVDVYGAAMNIGAGTVCTREELQAAHAAGVSFVVTPVCDPTLIVAAKDLALFVVPGALTPTEVYRGWAAGADMIKVFPADTMGPKYIKSLQGPLSQVPLIPTGGVSLETIEAYRDAGADGYGVGGTMFDRDRIAAGDWVWLTNRVAAFKNKLSA